MNGLLAAFRRDAAAGRFPTPAAWAAWLLVWLASSVAAAQAPALPESFQRIYVPLGRSDEWPREKGVEYVPVSGADFERTLSILRHSPLSDGASLDARLTEAAYVAAVDEQGLVTGHVDFTLRTPGGSQTALPLAPWNMAVRRAVWLNVSEKGAASGLPAILGHAADGTLVVLAEQSGRLRVEWSLQGQPRLETGSVTYTWALPNCPVKHWQLDVPTRWQPQVNVGLLTPAEGASQGLQRWQWQLGGVTRAELTLRLRRTAQVATSARQTSHYVISRTGLELAAEWALDIGDGELAAWDLSLDSGLQVVEARLGDQPISWTPLPPEGAAGPATRIRLHFPRKLTGTGRHVQLAAIAPWEIDQNRMLPGVRPLDGSWQQGEARIQVRAPLVLRNIQLLEGRVAAPWNDGELRVQLFVPTSAIVLCAGTQPVRPSVRVGTTLELEPGGATCRMIVDLSQWTGRQVDLTADVAPRWSVQSVEAVPASLRPEWRVEGQVLNIRLPAGHSTDSPARLVIVGRRQPGSVLGTWPVEELMLVRLRDVIVRRRLCAVVAQAPLAVDVDSNGFPDRLDPQKLADDDAALLVRATPQSLVFSAGDPSAAGTLTVSRQESRFDAAIRSMVGVGASSVLESYLFRCTPSGSELSGFLVQFSQRREMEFTWTISGEGENALSARRLTLAEQAEAGLPAEGEVWAVTLRGPRAGTVEIAASRSVPRLSPHRVCLASLPQADSQTGTLVVFAVDAGVQLRIGQLRPIPVDRRALAGTAGGAPEQLMPLRAYRYDPTRDAAPGNVGAGDEGMPTVEISAGSAEQATPPGLVWQTDLRSHALPGGQARHELVLKVECLSAQALKLDFPCAVRALRLRVNDRDMELKPGGSSVSVPLPRAGLSVVKLEFSTKQDPWRTWQRLVPPLPRSSLPVVECAWTLHVPRGYRGELLTSTWSSDALDTSWPARLLGPLAPEWLPNGGKPPISRKHLGAHESGSSPAQVAAASTREPAPSADTLLWEVITLHGAAESLPELRVFHRAALDRLACALFPCVGLLLLLVGRRQWRLAAAAVLALQVAVLVASESALPLLTGALLGGYLGLVLAWLLPPVRMRRSPVVAGVRGAVAAGLLCAAPAISAQDPPPPQLVHRVLIPVAEDGQPPKDALFWVPRKLWTTMQQEAAHVAQQPRDWLLLSARYRALVGAGQAPEVTGIYDLAVYGPKRELRLDFGQQPAAGLPPQIVWEGESLPARWAAPGLLLISVDAPGTYRLEIPWKPAVVARNDGTWQATLPIMPCAQAALEMSFSDNETSVRRVLATGAVRRDESRRRLMAELGAVDRLEFEYRLTGAAGTALEVDELYWLQVQPGSVVVQARFVCRPIGGAMSELRLAADARWELLPGSEKAAFQVREEDPREPADGRALRQYVATLQRPASGPVTVEARFLLRDASGVGRFQFPRLTTVGAERKQRMLAYSLDSGLSGQPFLDDPAETRTVESFLQLWGPADRSPQAAFRLGDGERIWGLDVRPKPVRRTCETVLQLGFAPHRVRAVFEAVLKGEGALLHRVRVPRELRISELSIIEQAASKLAHFGQDDEGTVCVLLTAPAGPQQKLRLVGDIPVPEQGAWPLPEVAMLDHDLTAARVELYRQGDVQVRPRGRIEPLASASPESRAELGRPLGLVPHLEPLVVELAPNRPSVRGTPFFALLWQDTKWHAHVEMDLSIQTGAVDALHWILPPGVGLPQEIAPPATVVSQELAGGEGRRITLAPAAPLSGAAHLRFRLPVDAAANERFVAPSIRPAWRNVQQFYWLPMEVDRRHVTWETRGMARATLPPGLTAGPSGEVFRVVSSASRAVLSLGDSPLAEPAIRLHDAQLAWRPDGSLAGRSTFDLDPAGQSACTLHLPEGFRLLRLRLEGSPAQAGRLDNNRYRIPLHSDRLTQRLEVNFAGPLPVWPGGPAALPLPRLENVPTRRTLVTLRAPWDYALQPVDGGAEVDPATLPAARLQNVRQIVDEAVADADVVPWFSFWSEALAEVLHTARAAGGAARELALAAEAEQLEVARRLGTEEQLAQAMRSAEAFHEPPPPTSSGTGSARRNDWPVRCLDVAGPVAQFRVQMQQPGARQRQVHVGMAAGLAALGLLILTLAARLPWEWTYRLGHWVAVVLGLAWALWLTPSVVGWVLIGCSLWLAQWPAWRAAGTETSHESGLRKPAS